MRVKRQRRKLRGKYSGNCLSCSAKWSKCWYIASIDNQGEWETRLSKVVTPGDDEVCFQCWDAKIRTSPKRKVNYKASVGLESSEIVKRYTNRQKRRALTSDFEYTVHSSSGLYIALPNDQNSLCENFMGSKVEPTSIHKENTIFDEENAAILLSTAFRTIPQCINDANINTKISGYDPADLESVYSDDTAKRRGAYYCGECGKLKKGHMCDVASSPPQNECPGPASSALVPIQSINIQLSTVLSQLSVHPLPQVSPSDVTLPAVVAYAQPVVS